MSPLVMKVFDPFTTQPPSAFFAVVFSAARSDPPDGSVIPIAATYSPEQNFGSQRCFCSSVPRSTRYGAAQSKWMPKQLDSDAETFETSSANTALNR